MNLLDRLSNEVVILKFRYNIKSILKIEFHGTHVLKSFPDLT